MTNIIQRLHTRLGDFWWYSILMFVALRIGDVINAFVGLWLVPKYVPQEELGAVLPLTQFASALALPISILVLVFTKFIAQFRAQGEDGKVKSLLRWFIGIVFCAALLSIAIAKFTLPALFERIRIQDGSLTLLIIATGIISTISPVFNNALQGLKKFRAITIINLFCAPIRLVTMLIALPIRALSGYMLGQLLPQLYSITISCVTLRKSLSPSTKSMPFWRGNAHKMLRYLSFVSIWHCTGIPQNAIQTMIIRQRLPEIESAAYYMISRFTDLAAYAGVTLSFVIFPMLVERCRSKKDPHLLLKTNIATISFGGVVAAMLFFFGEYAFERISICKPYASFTTEMLLLSISTILGQLWANFTTHEIAVDNFRFLSYGAIITILHAIILVALSGHTYFQGILPENIFNLLDACKINTLRGIMIFTIVSYIIRLSCVFVHCLLKERRIK